MDSSQKRIFVGIAAYRDRDCANTIRDLFAKARWPDRISIGLCWQFLSPDDDDCNPVPVRADQCRVIRFPVSEAQGVCWARHHVQKLWRGEDYVLQIDSHMRFVEHWDEKLLAMYRACPSDRAILTNYPAAFTPPDQIDSHVVSVLYANGFDRDGMVKQNSIGHAPESMGPVPKPTAFCAAGFLFGKSGWIHDVPYDPLLYFIGEETMLAVRLYTHGWDMFTPTDVLVYHDYNNRPDRPRHWNDRPDWTKLNERSLRRVRHLLNIEKNVDPEVLRDIGTYGLGKIRSLNEYQEFADIDFKARTIAGKRVDDEEETPAARRARNFQMFDQIWRHNGWGSGETRSGPGSSLEATQALRLQLADLFMALSIHRLIDAGCGDCNWMPRISEVLEFYLGIDVVPEMIVANDAKLGHRRGHFFATRDITVDELPPVDAILCRDVMTHLPLADVKLALDRIKSSGAKFLIATTHKVGSNRDIGLGDWHAIDLNAAPFHLPTPQMLLAEHPGHSKMLGVWRLDSL